MTRKGGLFVLEGPDGSGKTTLSLELVNYLSRQGLECEYHAFPGRELGTIGRHIWDFHHSLDLARVKSITTSSLQLLHVAAHLDAIERAILPVLKKGVTVVLDRYWWSTWVYGLVDGANQQTLRAMVKMERAHWGKVRPSIVFLVQRNTQHETESTFRLHRLAEEYHKLADREMQHYPVQPIDNSGTLTEALSRITTSASLHVKIKSPSAHKGNDLAHGLPLELHEDMGSTPLVFSKLSPAKPTTVYDTYWRFAAERQALFFRRLEGKPRPWTEDKILQDFKFTNAYRASDRVSQYLIRFVIYEGDQSPEEVFFRTLVFKLFNRIGTWELLIKKLGAVTYQEYSFDRYDAILSTAIENHQRIYSAAYIMPSGGRSVETDRKHRAHLKLLERMMKDELPLKIAGARTMLEAFKLLRSYPMIGDFLGYQYVTDLNYTCITNFSETEFAVPGPGARSGIRKCFESLGGLNEAEIIHVVTMRQQEEFERLGLRFESLWGRPLQYIDCQNLFCEVDKYARVRHPDASGIGERTRIKQKYRPNLSPIQYWFPPKWGLNERIASGLGREKSYAAL